MRLMAAEYRRDRGDGPRSDRAGGARWRARSARDKVTATCYPPHSLQRTRGVAAQHASLSRWRSPVRIRSGPPSTPLPTPRPPPGRGVPLAALADSACGSTTWPGDIAGASRRRAAADRAAGRPDRHRCDHRGRPRHRGHPPGRAGGDAGRYSRPERRQPCRQPRRSGGIVEPGATPRPRPPRRQATSAPRPMPASRTRAWLPHRPSRPTPRSAMSRSSRSSTSDRPRRPFGSQTCGRPWPGRVATPRSKSCRAMPMRSSPGSARVDRAAGRRSSWPRTSRP